MEVLAAAVPGVRRSVRGSGFGEAGECDLSAGWRASIM